ncbi:NGG1p interacting factor NIF3, partial [Candidatus Hydrogenedentota bacterium]
MKAHEVYSIFDVECPMPWYKKNPVDGFKMGIPETEVRNVGVCWMATGEVIRAAREKGIDLLIA